MLELSEISPPLLTFNALPSALSSRFYSPAQKCAPEANPGTDAEARARAWPDELIEIQIAPAEGESERSSLSATTPRTFERWHDAGNEIDVDEDLLSSPSSASSSSLLTSPSLSALSPQSEIPLPPIVIDPDLDLPRDPLAQATYEAAHNIFYIIESFPSDGRPSIAPPFVREPLVVHAGERVRVLDDEEGGETSEFAARVVVLRTGERGLVPVWDLETPTERLARVNMEFNEAATCPSQRPYLAIGKETGTSTDGDAKSRVVHIHSRCIPSAMRFTSPFDDSDAHLDDSPFIREEPEVGLVLYETKQGKDEGLTNENVRQAEKQEKKVVFAKPQNRVIYRYPSAKVVDGEAGEGKQEDWWWAGWEEEAEESESEEDVEGKDAGDNDYDDFDEDDEDFDEELKELIKLNGSIPEDFVKRFVLTPVEAVSS